jgi:hypothetical protein
MDEQSREKGASGTWKLWVGREDILNCIKMENGWMEKVSPRGEWGKIGMESDGNRKRKKHF